ncbi:hypothetical protein LARI1_G005863, partial [Lachnellula arida]
RALSALITSCDHGVERPMVAQHIAASMILCHLEMLGMPDAVSLWFCQKRIALFERTPSTFLYPVRDASKTNRRAIPQRRIRKFLALPRKQDS